MLKTAIGVLLLQLHEFETNITLCTHIDKLNCVSDVIGVLWSTENNQYMNRSSIDILKTGSG